MINSSSPSCLYNQFFANQIQGNTSPSTKFKSQNAEKISLHNMDMMTVCLCVLVLSLQFVCGQYSSSPCPGVFDFENDGHHVYGKITLRPVTPVSFLNIRINFTVVSKLFHPEPIQKENGDEVAEFNPADEKTASPQTTDVSVQSGIPTTAASTVTKIPTQTSQSQTTPSTKEELSTYTEDLKLLEAIVQPAGRNRRAVLDNNEIGNIEPLNLQNLRIYNQGQAAMYRVHFPVTTPLPKVTEIVVNGILICSGPGDVSETGKEIRSLSLRHFSSDDSYSYTRITADECGVVAGGNEWVSLINNGKFYERGEIPWLVAIYRVVEDTLQFICGGTLVSDRHVVTAAHCMQRPFVVTPMSDIVVKIGVHNLNDWSDDLTVIRKLMERTIHKEYNPNTLENDILILTLNKPVQFNRYIRPACLWSGETELSRVVGATGVVAGWGDRSAEDPRGRLGEPKMVYVPIVSTKECRASKSDFHKLTYNTTLCAGDRNGSGPCRGDSGGGLYLLEGGKWRLRGVVSISLRNKALTCDLNEYVVFTDTAQFLPWIRNILSTKYFD